MNPRAFLFLALPIIASVSAEEAYRGVPDPATFQLLPPHCQARYALRSEASKIGVSPEQYPFAKWEKSIGQPALHVHHHCNGLRILSLLDRGKTLNEGSGKPISREAALTQAQGEFEYQLTRSDWTRQNLWLKAEAEWGLARVERLRGNIKESIAYYNKALSTFPEFWPPAPDLAKLLAETSLYAEAIAVLDTAIAKNPKITYLKNLRAKLERERTANQVEND